MNRQDSSNPFLLKLVLLVVLLFLALVVYLQFAKAPVQRVPAVIAGNSSAMDAVPIPIKTSHIEAPNIALSAIPIDDTPTPSPTSALESAPVALDPESARAAVHKVENGVYDRATTIFEREPVDVEWAGDHEQGLREMFSQHYGLQRVSANSISCHSSMCRIEVFTPRDTDADFFTAMFYDALANFRDGTLKAEAAITRRMEQGMTSVYVARKDHTLGFY